ncbi:MAG: hypothetical protein HDQ98_09120 [Lachnospiraceae bacterium]|nr:hypothetical protein [Lachnospiraceae bacterium]
MSVVNVSEDMELYASVRRRCRHCGEAFRIAQHFDVAVLPENGRKSDAENRRQNGTAYQDASRLQVVTIESAVYIVMKNDLAFVLAGTLNLYEHQSTYNPNMPLRFLIYLAQEYQKLVEQAQVLISS